MRPLVVGPSPVITPSRTMPRAHTATSRSSLIDISTAPISSSDISTKADIVLFFLLPDPRISCGRKRAINVTSPFGPYRFESGARRFHRKDVEISQIASPHAQVWEESVFIVQPETERPDH